MAWFCVFKHYKKNVWDESTECKMLRRYFFIFFFPSSSRNKKKSSCIKVIKRKEKEKKWFSCLRSKGNIYKK